MPTPIPTPLTIDSPDSRAAARSHELAPHDAGDDARGPHEAGDAHAPLAVERLESWPEVREWRKRTRAALLAERRALPLRDKKHVAAAVIAALEVLAPLLEGRRVGFYWPMKGEIDLVAFVRARLGAWQAAALPVVVERNRPVEFWRWTPRTPLSNRGVWNIPTPVERDVVVPDALLIPLVGFDAAGFRLGYGGGYYDRTLAGLGAVLKIGVGHELGRLATIYPQPHDVPMDVVVTERGRIHG